MTENGAVSPADRRRLSGDGATTPPGGLSSTSEGDMRKNSYRPGSDARLFLRAACNDDGTPVTARVEELLGEILAELRALRAERES